MSAAKTVTETSFSDLSLLHRGKVRDVYEIDDSRLLLVATDRISAFDCVIPTAINNKGRVLTAISAFWFDKLKDIVPQHLITTDIDKMPEKVRQYPELDGRSALVERTKVFPVECVVRGYLEGSGWKDYMASGIVCGHKLPEGLVQCSKLAEPIFSPATKAAEGHDENITEAEFEKILGKDTAEILRSASLALYNTASAYAAEKGIIIADTKFEFGMDRNGRILLIDEVLTPDSSRFWDARSYSPGKPQASFDKQFVREYLETLDWDKTPPAPPLPDDVAKATSERYMKAYEMITGHQLRD